MRIKVKSSDSFSQKYEKIFEVIETRFLDEKKEYHYNDEHGLCRVILYDDYLEIFRSGKINSKQIFKLEEKTQFLYITKEFRGKYETFTKNFFKKNNKISLKYDIIQGSEILNTINLELYLIKD